MIKKGDTDFNKDFENVKKKVEKSKKDPIAKDLFKEDIANYSKMEKQFKNISKYAKIFLVITLIVFVVSFIVGLFIPYHCLVFDYEYRGIFSALATPVFPVAIIYLIYSIISAKGKVLDKAKVGVGMVGKFIVFYLLSAIISLFAFILVLALDGEGFIDKYFLIYHNRNYVFERMKWDCDNYKKCILDEIPDNAKEIVKSIYDNNLGNYKYFLDKGDSEKAEEILKREIKDSSVVGKYGVYGFREENQIWLDDYSYIIEVINREYKDERSDFFYYRFNWKTYEVEEITKKEYEKLKEEYQKVED